MLTDRQDIIGSFLDAAGWGAAARHPLPGDASTRRYVRLSLNGRTAMLMDQPQHAESPAAPADADVETRRALGYNALARLAGADCARFIACAEHLRAARLSAPAILAADPAQGLVLIEDFGDALYADVLASGADDKAMYFAAIEALAVLHDMPAPKHLAGGMPLHAYDAAAMLAEIDLMSEWFFPLGLNRAATAGEIEDHRGLWRAALAAIREPATVFVHRDYHAQNLFWLPGRTGIAKVGMIDFQDAVAGSPAYDLVSLLKDARRDVAPALAEAAASHYLDLRRGQGTAPDAQAFAAEMAIISAQRGVKIVGIFARLFKRDGKARYLALLPRVWGYLARDLEHPALKALKSWYDKAVPPAIRPQ